jgi:hypothetical protein
MKIISHRGNIKGPVSDKENRPSYIDCAIQIGFDVEVDIRVINNQIWLGHDIPSYTINSKWIMQRSKFIWFHCKNIDAVILLKSINKNIKYFCHVSDPYVITSTGHLWVHNLQYVINDSCIIPLLSLENIKQYNNRTVYAICTDFASQLI